ncbi:hypothetical protein X801_01669 [Opisthorchis viverrini]|uniref:Uncharacterized protein n=1 Tax=Opisthorchis viverrini TaxID=6198 RepID=A0A1S8X6S2_OPIVI|nr:hypothetical protein X801_01669 [Opisthorchis viverrini]
MHRCSQPYHKKLVPNFELTTNTIHDELLKHLISVLAVLHAEIPDKRMRFTVHSRFLIDEFTFGFEQPFLIHSSTRQPLFVFWNNLQGLRPINDRQRKWMPLPEVLRTNTPEQTVVIDKVGILFLPGSSISEPVLNTMLRAAARYYATLTGKPVSTEEDEFQTTIEHCPEGQSSLENYGFQITKRRPMD